MIKNDITQGIVINKVPYNDYHEILNVLNEDGIVESHFYQNVNKNKKKLKIIIPCKVNISYYKTSGMNKIITLDVENYYQNITKDLYLSSYVGNILELISYDKDNNYYLILDKILSLINDNVVDEKVILIYFNIKYLFLQGYTFKYKKIDKQNYLGYSFTKNLFIDYIETKNFFKLDNKLVKLIYILSTNNLDIIEKISLNYCEYKILFRFLNILLNEYVGIFTKSYNKILELEEFSEFFRGGISDE